jgi:hypothetical protein
MKIDAAEGDLLTTKKIGRRPPDHAARSTRGARRTGRWKKLHNEEVKNLSTGDDKMQGKNRGKRENPNI